MNSRKGIRRIELVTAAAKKFCANDYEPWEREALAWAIWTLLPSSARDTLRALVLEGPLWDGDVPSKIGRDFLLTTGFAAKAVVKDEQGHQVATYDGWAIFKIAEELDCDMRPEFFMSQRRRRTAAKQEATELLATNSERMP